MVFLSRYVHKRSQISKANIVRTFWCITQIIIWCYLKINIKKVIANRWITEYFHDLLFPWQPFWMIYSLSKSTSTFHFSLLFGTKILKEIITDETISKNYKFPSFYLKWHVATKTVAMVFLPQHVLWIASFWKADSHRNILSYYTCCYLVLPLNYA